jgi:hypothetical protein
MRWLSLAPWYHLIRLVAPRSFRIENHWYVARKN